MKIKTTLLSPGIIVGTLLGGMIGVAVYLILLPSPSIFIALLTFLAGGVAGGMVAHRKGANGFQVHKHADRDTTMILRQEELDILTKKMDTADVQIHKEIISEEKTFTVPVTREELVVQINNESGEHNSKDSSEIIRIPIREEEVDVTTHPIILNDVSVFKNEIKETVHVDETLKRETVNVDVSGDVIIHDTNAKKR